MIKDKGVWLNFLLSLPKSDEEEAAVLKDLWGKKKAYLRDTFEALKKAIKEIDERFNDNIIIEDLSEALVAFDGDEAFNVFNYLLSPNYQTPGNPNSLLCDLCYLNIYYTRLVNTWPHHATFRIDHVMTQTAVAVANFYHSVKGYKVFDLPRHRRHKERYQAVCDIFFRMDWDKRKSFNEIAEKIASKIDKLNFNHLWANPKRKGIDPRTVKRHLVADEDIKRALIEKGFLKSDKS